MGACGERPVSAALRWTVTVGLVAVALVLQVTFFPHVAWHGVVPNLCLLVVVAAALVRGPEQAAFLGFVAGVLLDLAPPADHVAGRWALALVIVGYVAGRMRQDTKPTAVAVVMTVAAASFVGTSVYALSGLLLQDPVVSVSDLLPVIVVSVVWDVLLTPFVLPPVMRLFTALDPAQAHV
jgi:rod shape-determining protein MreD